MIRPVLRRAYLVARGAFLIGLSPFIRRIRPRSGCPSPPARILIICQPRIGDNVLITPVLRALRSTFPSAEIVLLAVPGVASLLGPSPRVDRVICRGKGIRGFFRTVSALRRTRIDIAVDANSDYTLAGAVLAWVSGARFSLGYDIERRGVLFAQSVPWYNERVHMVEDMLSLVAHIGVHASDRAPELTVSNESSNSVDRFLESRGIGPGQKVIGIHPGGHYPTQRWPAERFALLIDKISRSRGAGIVILGGSREHAPIETIRTRTTGMPVCFLDRPVGELAAVIARCSLLVCNNSGPLHMAVALKTPTVSTMGPTVAERWWPVGETHIVLRKDLPCISCNSGTCRIGTHACMNLITVQEMEKAVTDVWERTVKAQ